MFVCVKKWLHSMISLCILDILIKYNLEKKRRLKEIFKEYYCEDFIKKLLSKLYEKEIKIIEAQISKK